MSRWNVKWSETRAAQAHAEAKGKGLRHVPHPIESETGWRVYDLPPGIAKKDEEQILEWLVRHEHKIHLEPEGFGELIEPIDFQVVDGSAQSVESGTEWYQTFLNLSTAHTVAKGFKTAIAITDNGLGSHPWLSGFLLEQKIFDSAETTFDGGSHGTPVTGLVHAAAIAALFTNYKIAGTDVRCSWNDVSAAWLHAREMNIPVINTSWGGGVSLLLADTARIVRDSGMAIICAAGNSADYTQFPASNPNCYAVSAFDNAGNIASFSCRGKIEISAPGVSLMTTTSGGGWASFSGTSGAAPLIAGLVALIISKNPTWSGVQAMEHLLATATPKLPVENYGAGHPNILKALGIGDTTPPPEPAPEPMNLNSLATWSSDPAPYTKDGLLLLLDGQAGTLCLWKSDRAQLAANFGTNGPVEIQGIDITCSNATKAYPQRNPSRIEIASESSGTATFIVPKFQNSYETNTISIPNLRGTDWRFTVYDSGGNILECSGLALKGIKVDAGDVPPPPAELPSTTLAALAVIENDMTTFDSSQDELLKSQLNRLLAMI